MILQYYIAKSNDKTRGNSNKIGSGSGSYSRCEKRRSIISSGCGVSVVVVVVVVLVVVAEVIEVVVAAVVVVVVVVV